MEHLSDTNMDDVNRSGTGREKNFIFVDLEAQVCGDEQFVYQVGAVASGFEKVPFVAYMKK